MLRAVPELRTLGVDTKGLQDPDDSLTLDDDAVAVLNKWLDELYQTRIEDGTIA